LGPTSLAELSVLGTYDLMCFFVVTSYNFEVASLMVVLLDIEVLLLTLTHWQLFSMFYSQYGFLSR